jgi:AcrR family transcriptional regulator
MTGSDASGEREPWTGAPLPRGRHGLGADSVRTSQRERLLRAMAEVVAARGYEGATVPQVVAAAHVSRTTFYAFFADKTDCFIALCEQLGEHLADELAPAATRAASAAEAVAALDRGLTRYLRRWQDQPAFARAYFVELPAAGQRALEERDRQRARFEAVLRRLAERARTFDPHAGPLRDVDVTAAVIVISELVAREIRADRLDRLSELVGELRRLLLKLLVSERAADFADAVATGS